MNIAPPYPVKGISFQWILANVLQQAHKIDLFPDKLSHNHHCEKHNNDLRERTC